MHRAKKRRTTSTNKKKKIDGARFHQARREATAGVAPSSSASSSSSSSSSSNALDKHTAAALAAAADGSRRKVESKRSGSKFSMSQSSLSTSSLKRKRKTKSSSSSSSSSGGKSAQTELFGSTMLRHRLILATLTGRPLVVKEIRALDDNPGLRDFEASLLRLLDKITNGTAIRINETGTTLRFRPGVIVGGKYLEHKCPTSRGLGYYIEALLCLAPFAKGDLSITLKGVTNHPLDTSVDLLRTVTMPLMKQFGMEGTLELKIVTRGALPLGGGEVQLNIAATKELKTVHLLQPGKVKRVRGVAFTAKVSPQIGNRMVSSARFVFNHYIPDVYIYSDHYKGKQCGLSPGYSISLVAQSTTDCVLSAECNGTGDSLPEDLGKLAANVLCEEIAGGACVDSAHQWFVLLLMTLTPEDVSRVRFGKLTKHTIKFLRLLREIVGVTFKIKSDDKDNSVLCSCMGIGFKNFARTSV